jgi:hypothetical protein
MSKYEKSCKHQILLNILISALVSIAVIIIISFCGHRNFVNAVKNGTCIITRNNILQNKNTIKIEFENSFLEHVTGFYETIIILLTTLIGLVSFIGFLYSKSFSKTEITDAVNEQLNTDFFKSYFKDHFENSFKLDKKRGRAVRFS